MKNDRIGSEKSQVNALVLAGGASTRMGLDKSQLKYYGETQEIHTAHMCRNLGLETYISKKYDFDKDHIDIYPVIKDEYKNLGPLAAILSAFKYDLKSAWLIVACDLPFLNQDVLNALLINRRPEKMSTCFQLEKNNFPEPLISIYEQDVFPVMMNYFSSGGTSLKQLLMNINIHRLTLGNEHLLTNVNTITEKKEAVQKMVKINLREF